MDQFISGIRTSLRRYAVAYLVLFVTLVPAVIASYRAHVNSRTRNELRFKAVAENLSETMQSGLDGYLGAAFAVRGFLEASDNVTPEEWERFVDLLQVPDRLPGLQSLGYAELAVPGASTPSGADEEAAKVPRDQQEPRLALSPVIYFKQFVPGPGFATSNAMAESLQATTFERLVSWRDNEAARPAVIPMGDGRAARFMMYLPVRRAGGEGTNWLQGVTFGVFKPEEFLRRHAPHTFESQATASLREASAERSNTANVAESAGRQPHFASTHPVSAAGQRFLLQVSSLPDFEKELERHLALLVFLGASVFSFLLFIIALMQARAREVAEQWNQRLRTSEDRLRTLNGELQRNVAEQKAAEAQLAHERDLLRTLLEHSPDRVYFKDCDSRFIQCSRTVAERLGLSDPAAAFGKSDFDLLSEEDARRARAAEQEIMRTGQPLIDAVEREISRDGQESWVLTSKMPLKDRHGRIIGTFGISKDITPLKHAELELEKEKEQLAVTLRSIGDGVITTDVEGRIVLFNPVAARLTGWFEAEAVGRHFREVFCTVAADHAETNTELIRRMLKGSPPVVRDAGTLLVSRDGSEREISQCVAPIVDQAGNILGAVLVFRDITEKLKTQAELHRANKLESIGLLAGGIAHDFNNILTIILGNLSLARLMSEGASEAMLRTLAEAEKAGTRARDLTQRLLTFAKGGAPIKRSTDPAALVRTSLAAESETHQLTCRYFIAPDVWSVAADEAQLAQVLRNLASFSRAMMTENPRLDVHVLNQEITNDPQLLLPPGKYVRISLRDYGRGLQPDQLSKIFDPYFAGRKTGHGLELATAYSIVRKHEGQIRVESSAGEGTVFHIYLPAEMSPTTRPTAAPRVNLQSGAGRRVLVMDDEPAIRALAVALLERAGYHVDAASDGGEAIEKYQAARERGEPFDVVIVDLTVPNGMGGEEAVRLLRLSDPGIRAIVSSGYSNDRVMANYRDFGFSGVVPKPYRPEDLLAAVAELLDESSAGRDASVSIVS